MRRVAPGALLLLAVIAWFGTLGYRDLIHPDEGRYAEIARQMLASGDWITPRLNGILYFEKPALQNWATAAAFAVFGISDFAARFWPGLTGAFAVLALWWTTRAVLGPRIAANGLIEGKSPFSSQSDFVPDTLGEALAAIDWYAAHGYRQLKLYNSIRPEWVKPMAAHARQLGLRVGGHVPAFMTAAQAVQAGYRELHHINQVTLNFLVGPQDDTRTLLRFTLPGDRAHTLKLDDARTRDFIALLRRTGTVVDPTAVAFEAMYLQRQGSINPSYAAIASHLPACAPPRWRSTTAMPAATRPPGR
jgi:hypothetical protein